MNMCYFKEQIHDELCGAKDYAQHAIEFKAMSKEWASLFLDMSSEELSHANHLYSMAKEYYNKISEAYEHVPATLSEIMECLSQDYVDLATKVRFMHELYNG